MSAIAVVLFIHFQIFLAFGSVVSETAMIVRREEDLELDQQLKILNRPAVKSFKTANGDIFDCVKIHKQPSLYHPLLEGHSIQRASNADRGRLLGRITKGSPLPDFKVNCPNNTVPIRRTSKTELMRAKSFHEKHADSVDFDATLQGEKDHFLENKIKISTGQQNYFYAGIDTKVDPKTLKAIKRGVYSSVSVHNPHINSGQWSAAIISVRRGFDFIRVGWMVNPGLYGDKRTHLFTQWQADGKSKSGCYNILCPGFVHTNPNIPLDLVYDTKNYIISVGMSISQDINGNWWFRYSSDNVEVGYWPKELFTQLDKGAQDIKLRGQVYIADKAYWPEMGTGVYARANFDMTAYMHDIIFFSSSAQWNHPVDDMIQIHEDHCYLAGNNYEDGTGPSKLGYTFMYGGAGGPKVQCPP